MRGAQNYQSITLSTPELNTPSLATVGPNSGDDIVIMVSGALVRHPVRK